MEATRDIGVVEGHIDETILLNQPVLNRLNALESENRQLKEETNILRSKLQKLEDIINRLRGINHADVNRIISEVDIGPAGDNVVPYEIIKHETHYNICRVSVNKDHLQGHNAMSMNMPSNTPNVGQPEVMPISHECVICDMTFTDQPSLGEHCLIHIDGYCNSTQLPLGVGDGETNVSSVGDNHGVFQSISETDVKLESNEHHVTNTAEKPVEIPKESGELLSQGKNSQTSLGREDLEMVTKDEDQNSGTSDTDGDTEGLITQIMQECDVTLSSDSPRKIRSKSKRKHKVQQKHSLRKKHTRGETKPVEKYVCPICARKYNSRYGLKYHMMRHKGVRYRSCQPNTSESKQDGSTAELDTSGASPEHSSDEDLSDNVPKSDESYDSAESGEERASAKSKSPGKRKDTPGEYKCPVCSKILRTENTLERHMRFHTGDGLHTCAICGKKVQTTGSMKRHMMTHNGGLYPCPHCSKSYSTKANLDGHLWRHTGIKNYTCETCGVSYTSAGMLRYHKRRRHEGFNPTSCCPICGKVVASLAGHMLVHKDEKPHNCSECGKSFRTRSHMRDHMKVHSENRPFTCEVCGLSTKSQSTLNKHRMLHDERKPVECHLCGKNIISEKGLKQHMLIHTDTKPHSCDVCQKAFKTTSTLRKHKLIHTDIRPYTCTYCHKSFRQSQHLKTHHKLVHGMGKYPADYGIQYAN